MALTNRYTLRGRFSMGICMEPQSLRLALEGYPARIFPCEFLESVNLVDGDIDVGDVSGGSAGSPFIGCMRGFRINTRDIAFVEVVRYVSDT